MIDILFFFIKSIFYFPIDELKTQRTHSTSESSDYNTLENYISNVLPNKDNEGVRRDLHRNLSKITLFLGGGGGGILTFEWKKYFFLIFALVLKNVIFDEFPNFDAILII